MQERVANRVADIFGNSPMVRLEQLSPPGGATILG